MNDLQNQINKLQDQINQLQGIETASVDPVWWIAWLTIFALAYVQNISFSIVSRARNRDNVKYHVVASIFSNSIWFLTFRELVKADMTFVLFIPYVIATVLGSVTGAHVSMLLERILGASADGHLKKAHGSSKRSSRTITVSSDSTEK